MISRPVTSLAFLLLCPLAMAQLSPTGATASFRGSLPPKPVAALSAEEEAGLEKTLAELQVDFEFVKKHPRSADAAIFSKPCATRWSSTSGMTKSQRTI